MTTKKLLIMGVFKIGDNNAAAWNVDEISTIWVEPDSFHNSPTISYRMLKLDYP